MNMQIQRILVGAAMLFVGCHGLPPYPVQSDLTSGGLIAAAGSIGLVALAASVTLAAMSSLQNSKECNCKSTTPENIRTTTDPGPSCEGEKQQCEQENDLLRASIDGLCITIGIPDFCLQCVEILDDENACNDIPICTFDEILGVCRFDPVL